MSSWKLPFPDNTITGHFGTMSAYRKSKGMQPHSGTDWAPGAGTIIPAITAGQVKIIQWSNVLGWVMVQSADNLYIGYCHLACAKHGAECKGPIVSGCKTPFSGLKLGDSIKLGQPVGRVGNTGSATTGAHLHATLSKTVKGVFGATSAKQDLHAHIKSIKPAQKVTAPVTKTATQVIYACPHCKKELK